MNEIIENKVEGLLSAYKYNSDVCDYIEVVDFTKRQGIEIVKGDLSGKTGFLLIQSNRYYRKDLGPRVIGVGNRGDLHFNRFMVAHELGHFFLHWTGEENYLHIDYTCSEKNKEKGNPEADYFALALLMPRKSFIRRYNNMKHYKLGDICSRLSRIYDVSIENVIQRLEDLEIIST